MGWVRNIVSNPISLVEIGLDIAFPEFIPITHAVGTAIQGGSPEDIAKSAAMAYVGQQAMSGLTNGAATDVTVPTEAPALPSSFDQYLAPSGITVPTEAAALPSSFDQYLTPQQTAISDIANAAVNTAPAINPSNVITTPSKGWFSPVSWNSNPVLNQTSISDIANTGVETFPVPDQTPFQGTSMLDVANTAPQVGTPEAIQQLANNAQQAQAIQAPIVPTDIAAAPAATGQSLADIANVGPSQTQPALPSSFDQYAVQNPNYSLSTPAATTDMGGAKGLQQSTLPTTAPTTDMGGAQGITAPVSANLTDMGGAQGLTTAAAGGGTLGQTGVNTGANLAGNLGTTLAATNTGITQPATTGKSMSDILSNLTPTQIATLGQGLLSGIGGISTNNAIASGQAAQQAAAQQSLGTLGNIYNTNMAAVTPYQQAGQGALTQINQQMPYLTHQFDANDLNAQLAPNYQFMLGQGQMANQRAANVGGGALSGNTLQGLNKFTQDYAGTAYQNAFKNYNDQRSNIYNTLSNIAGLGTSANAQGIGAGQSYGQNVTNLNTGLAAAQAGANVAQAQNTSNTLSNIGNAATLATLLGQNNTISDAAAAAKDANSVIGAYF